VYLRFSAYLDLEKFRECRVSFDAVLVELNDSFFAVWLSNDGKIRVRCEDNLAQRGGRLVRITGRVVDIEGELVVDIKSADDVALVEPIEVISDRKNKRRSAVGNTQLLGWNFRAFPGWKRRPRRLPPPPRATLPRCPESLRGELIGTTVRLTWQELNYNGVAIVGYRIEHSRDGGEWSVAEDVAAQPCEKTIVGLERGVDYRFCVSAEGAAGFGRRSEPLSLGSISEEGSNGSRPIDEESEGDNRIVDGDDESGESDENDQNDRDISEIITEKTRSWQLVAVSGAVIALVAILTWFLR